MLSDEGIFPVTLHNPQPEGGTSNSVDFIVINAVPSITSIDPAEIIPGTESHILNIYGFGFFNNTEIIFGGVKRPTDYINNTNLQIGLTSEDLNTPGQYEVIAYNSPPGGGNSNKVILTIKSPLEITITSPSGGETINKSKVMVKGTVKSDTHDIGITVNGIVADIFDNEWIANNVPLVTGANVITATATDYYGHTKTDKITIFTNDTTQHIELLSNITSGILPLTTSVQ